MTGKSKLDRKALMAYKKQYISAMPAALEDLLSQFGFDLIKDNAEFID